MDNFFFTEKNVKKRQRNFDFDTRRQNFPKAGVVYNRGADTVKDTRVQCGRVDHKDRVLGKKSDVE